MPTKAYYPCMTADHWTNEPLKVIDSILLSYFTTLKSQSNAFSKDIYSFAYIMSIHKANTQAMAEAIKTDLTAQFNKYFDGVDITTSVTKVDISKHTISVTGIVQDSSQELFDIGRVFSMEGSVLTQVLKVHNG